MTCFGCERNEQLLKLTDEKVLALVEEQLSMEINLSSDNLRESRLAICASCPFRQSHTCTKCGCYVTFRASLKLKSCPVGKW